MCEISNTGLDHVVSYVYRIPNQYSSLDTTEENFSQSTYDGG